MWCINHGRKPFHILMITDISKFVNIITTFPSPQICGKIYIIMPKKSRHDDSSYNPTLSHGVIAIVILIAAGIISLSFFDKAGALGVMLNQYVLSFLFGSMRYAIPFVLLVYIWYLLQGSAPLRHPVHTLGTFLFFSEYFWTLSSFFCNQHHV